MSNHVRFLNVSDKIYILSYFSIPFFLTHLYLAWSDVKLLKDVDKKRLHFIPGVDGV